MTHKRTHNGSQDSISEPGDPLRTAEIGSQAHLPVLYQEIILALRPHSPGRYVDATLGAGGHARGILEASSPNGCLLGLDVDPQALEIAAQTLAPFGSRAALVHSSYIHFTEKVHQQGWDQVNGVLIDLGVSSMQLDTPARGFSFSKEGELDMRFDPRRGTSAAELIDHSSEAELAEILWKYGEEQNSRRIARAIVQARPIRSTLQLAAVVSRAAGGQKNRIHPATKTFQALRIAVNRELDALEEVLPQAIGVLGSGSRLAVISFHSLEDRMVKQFFRRESRDCICPPEQPVCMCGHKATIVEINRSPLTASVDEINRNPRARSAKLRIIEKL